MNISSDTLNNLEFHVILDEVSALCVNEIAKQRIQNQVLYFHKAEIERLLTEIEELKEIIQVEQSFPLAYYHDMRPILHKIEPRESYLEIEDCQKIQRFIEISSTVKSYIKKFERFKLLNTCVNAIDPLTVLVHQIANTIDPAGQIYDNASPDLKSIRKEIAHLSKQIHIQLERIQKKYAEHLQDDYITLREGRLVLPVREFSVNKVPGIVHGQSATGQTQYIEPMQVVALNNDMQVAYQREKKEIIRILKRIAENIRNETGTILNNFEALVHLDAMQAKARYALTLKAIAPEIHPDFSWHITNGYHPILFKKMGKEAVPLSLDIGDDFQILIITGPNAGGKTVALKTIGLLQILLQSGYQIPVGEGSYLPICHNIYAIIGDEQSIENDLSTFSSHILKVNRIVEDFSTKSLVLIDEIGTGTDPAEGAALAVTFLEKLLIPEVVTLVTTHQGALKAFAHNTPGVKNGAMQFDAEKLTPRFILETGIPGSSYAFDISRRLGVSEEILNRAGELLGGAHTDMEQIILELAAMKDAYEQKIVAVSLKETELEGLKNLYKNRADELKKKSKSFERKAFSEAQEILKSVNKTIESVIREIKESKADHTVIKAGKRKIEQVKATIQKKSQQKEPERAQKIIDLKPGLLVQSTQYAVEGEINQILAGGKEVEIMTGNKRMIVPVSDLIVKENSVLPNNASPAAVSATIPQVGNELDLRGLQGEEALVELSKYLDHTMHTGWKEVRIIHGKGTGALRRAVHLFLKNYKHCKSYRLGSYGEGDTGVTVIEF
jgi:DNA mismatch repair protein MutS2